MFKTRVLNMFSTVLNLTKAFILFNSFHFSCEYFQDPKMSTNLGQDIVDVLSGFYSKFGSFGTNFQHPGLLIEKANKLASCFRSLP